MQSRTRTRLIRNIVAGLMQSELTESELRDLAEDLSSGRFGRDVGLLLRDVLFSVQDAEAKQGRERERQVGELSVEAIATNIVKRRKMSKKAVADIIMRVSPRFGPRELGRSGTISDMLKRFFQKSSPHEQNKFLSILDSGTAEDAYLRGIVGRS